MWAIPGVGLLMSVMGIYGLRVQRRMKEKAAAEATAEPLESGDIPREAL